MERKKEVMHLELFWAETNKSATDIIISGVKANSRKEPGDQPIIEIHINSIRWTPEHLIEIATQQLAIRKKGILKDCERVIEITKELNS